MTPCSWLIATYLTVISCFHTRSTDAARDNNGKHGLDNIVFRVSAFEYLPFMVSQRGARGNITYSGVSVDILELMIQYLKLRIVYVPVDPVEVEKYGIGVALIHQLQRDEVDFAPFPFLQILEYSYQIELCYPFTVDDFMLMQPYPKEVSRLSAPLTPFTKDVWLLFILSIVVFSIMMTVVIYTRNRTCESRKIFKEGKATIWEQLYKQFEYVLTIITSQGNVTPQEVKKFVFRLMLALWLLSMVVLINAYIGTYTANMAVPKLERTVDTLEELAASKKFKMTIELNSDLSYKALSADSGSYYKNFGDSFRKHPELLLTNPLDAILNVATKDCVYPGSVNIVNYYINADLKASGECRMTIATKPLLYFVPLTTALQKGSPYTETFNLEFMLLIWEHGILSRLRHQTFPPMSRRCRTWGQEKVGNKPLKLKEFYGIFVLFLGGCISSILTFLAELLVAKFNKNNK